MGQLNIHMTPELEKDLRNFMKKRNITTKSGAIRLAIKEGLAHTLNYAKKTNFADWAGLAAQAPINNKHRFKSDDDLWK